MNAQRQRALVAGNARRAAVAQLRRALQADPPSIRDVLLNPPEMLAGMLLVDVVCLPCGGRRPRTAVLMQLGRRAIDDGVNLLAPLDRATPSARAWVAANAVWVPRGRKWSLVLGPKEPR